MFTRAIGVVAGVVLLVGIIGIFILAASGPTNSDIENLQSQIDGVKVSAAQASSDAQAAQSAAADASAKASAAESVANRTAQYAQDTNSALDKLIKSTKAR
jgi:predicted PurR-regulated permease PerM